MFLRRFHIDNMTIKKVRLERKDMVGYDDIHSQYFKDTVSAYKKVGQDSQLYVLSYIAVLDAYKRHENKAEDASC